MKGKGFFFTLLVFIFFFLVLISVTTWTRIQEAREEQLVAYIRISRMNEFSDMMRDDAKRATQLIGLNALRVATTYVAFNNNRKYLNNSNCLQKSCIYELMYNATIERNDSYIKLDGWLVNFSRPDQMGNRTLSKWDEQMLLLADRSNFNLSISRDSIVVYQSDPWNVKIGYNLRFNISDRALDSIFRKEIVPVLITIPITNYTYGG
jgi:hypothetical protein